MGEAMKFYSFCEMTNWELEALWQLFAETPDFHGEVPQEHFNKLLSQGYLQLWVEPDALTPVGAMVTEIRQIRGEKYLAILAIVIKDYSEYEKHFTTLKVWAAKNGCTTIRATCKEAQTRLFTRKGFVKVANVIELELKDE
jgi:hypothetical protein